MRRLNDRPINPSGQFVLYWITAARRLRSNFALQLAVDRAIQLGRPLLILEALDADYPWASARFHRFVLDGMSVSARLAAQTPALYFPYVEPASGDGRGLIAHLSTLASLIVTDHFPAFIVPAVGARAANQSACLVEAVDSNGLIPLAAHGRAFSSARSYRAFVQRELRVHLRDMPEDDPLARLPVQLRLRSLPETLLERWSPAHVHSRGAESTASYGSHVDPSVPPAPVRGGGDAGRHALDRFLSVNLPRYARDHNHPDADCTSRLSPYLHFGHLSAHEVFAALMTHERWTTRRLAQRGGGGRDGWWGVSDSANVFLDQLVVWRELAFNGCEYIADYTRFETVPAWARSTLAAHARDTRQHYDFDALETATTQDAVWNAAQRQLVSEGWFHGYLRMLWGKKILEWAPDPQTALDWMEALMNRYSLDGRDPVSYASFTWVVGRYDRPWPERPVFGTVRSMSSDSARRKLKMKAFLAKYGERGTGEPGK